MTTLFLLCSLFFPRISLLYCYLTEQIPSNDTPFILDAILSIFFPRFLIAYWGYEDVHILWTILFILVGIMEMSASRVTVRYRKY